MQGIHHKRLFSQENHPELLDAKMQKDFWIFWDDAGTIVVGKGKELGRLQLVQVHDSEPVTIDRISVTSMNANRAKWKLIQTPGECWEVAENVRIQSGVPTLVWRNDVVLVLWWCHFTWPWLDALVHDCSISIADAMEILQSCTELSTSCH